MCYEDIPCSKHAFEKMVKAVRKVESYQSKAGKKRKLSGSDAVRKYNQAKNHMKTSIRNYLHTPQGIRVLEDMYGEEHVLPEYYRNAREDMIHPSITLLGFYLKDQTAPFSNADFSQLIRSYIDKGQLLPKLIQKRREDLISWNPDFKPYPYAREEYGYIVETLATSENFKVILCKNDEDPFNYLTQLGKTTRTLFVTEVDFLDFVMKSDVTEMLKAVRVYNKVKGLQEEKSQFQKTTEDAEVEQLFDKRISEGYQHYLSRLEKLYTEYLAYKEFQKAEQKRLREEEEERKNNRNYNKILSTFEKLQTVSFDG